MQHKIYNGQSIKTKQLVPVLPGMGVYLACAHCVPIRTNEHKQTYLLHCIHLNLNHNKSQACILWITTKIKNENECTAFRLWFGEGVRSIALCPAQYRAANRILKLSLRKQNLNFLRVHPLGAILLLVIGGFFLKFLIRWCDWWNIYSPGVWKYRRPGE